MSNVQSEFKTKRTRVYKIPNPSYWVELGKMYSMITLDADRAGYNTDYDDFVEISADDEWIYMKYKMRKDDDRGN